MRLMFENSTVCLIVDGLILPVISLRDDFGLTIDSDHFWSGFVCRDDFLFFDGEFDPGSGRTLAACLTHASRAERLLRGYSSGERVSNT